MTEERERRRQLAGRQLAKEFEQERQKAAALQRRSDRIKKRLRNNASGKPTPAIRRDVEFDELLFKGILAALTAGDPVRFTALKGPGVTDYRHQKRRKTEDIKNPDHAFHVLHWDHTGDRMKALSWAMALSGRNAKAMSLHLSEKVINEATTSSQGFANHMRERIKRKLNYYVGYDQGGVPDFFFMVETKQGTPPHLHGGIVIPEAAGAEGLVRKALKAAGGEWGNSGRQLDLRPFTSLIGWVRYISKWRLTTMLHLGDKNIAAATNGLRSQARSWYEQARRSEEAIG